MDALLTGDLRLEGEELSGSLALVARRETGEIWSDEFREPVSDLRPRRTMRRRSPTSRRPWRSIRHWPQSTWVWGPPTPANSLTKLAGCCAEVDLFTHAEQLLGRELESGWMSEWSLHALQEGFLDRPEYAELLRECVETVERTRRKYGSVHDTLRAPP